MNKLVFSFLLFLMIFIQSCLTPEAECKKTEAPEINVGLLFAGSIQINDPGGNDITILFTDAELNMLYYKVYCTGKNNGPFTSEFTINENGTLYKKSIGYWSFRMNNTKDYIRVQFFIEGDNIGQEYRVTYDQLKAFDGGKPYLNFSIVVTADNEIYKTKSISLNIS
ncbi:MAG: hypothetical protein RQ743_11350 [Bacteroidales bacterium]|nr:hypothetical protein [Bacteroidales bacterium]